MSCCVNRKQKDGPDGETETTPGSPKDDKGTPLEYYYILEQIYQYNCCYYLISHRWYYI